MTPARKRPAPASARPWQCMILAVDTAARSGWAHYRGGHYIHSGEWPIEKREAIEALVEGFVSDAGDLGYPAVLVLERPFGGSNSGTLMALGAARHVWLTAWKRAGGSARKAVHVHVSTWRSRVLGVTRGETLRALERDVARRIKGAAAGPDEAPAILIGKWATHAAEVGKVLPAKLRKVLP